MRYIRKLWIENSSGQRRSLNGEDGLYASDLAGFGFSMSPSYADLTRGFFVPVSEDAEPQGAITMTLNFLGPNPYAKYRDFSNWLARSGALTIGYAPTPEQTFYRRISVTYLQKGELDRTGILPIPASFSTLTPWYRPEPSVLDLSDAGKDTSKRYPYSYPYAYGTDATASLSGTVYGDGHIPAALELRYYGAITNPKLRLVGNISGRTYGICSLAATLQPGDMLLYSSRYTNSYVLRRRGLEDTDLLDVLDLSTEPFFHVPVDEPCTLSVEASAAFSGYAELKTYYYYRSV